MHKFYVHLEASIPKVIFFSVPPSLEWLGKDSEYAPIVPIVGGYPSGSPMSLEDAIKELIEDVKTIPGVEIVIVPTKF